MQQISPNITKQKINNFYGLVWWVAILRWKPTPWQGKGEFTGQNIYPWWKCTLRSAMFCLAWCTRAQAYSPLVSVNSSFILSFRWISSYLINNIKSRVPPDVRIFVCPAEYSVLLAQVFRIWLNFIVYLPWFKPIFSWNKSETLKCQIEIS